MKAKVRATDLLDGKSIELECSIRKDQSAAIELLKIVRRKANRERIIRGINLTFGEAKLELISYGRVIATGEMTNNVFGGDGKLRATECVPYADTKTA